MPWKKRALQQMSPKFLTLLDESLLALRHRLLNVGVRHPLEAAVVKEVPFRRLIIVPNGG